MRKLLFLDLETTGLDEKTDFVLEVGALVVDAKTLEQEVAWSRCVYHTRNVRSDVPVRVPTELLFREPIVAEMHRRSGLIAECDGKDAKRCIDTDWELSELIRKHVLDPNDPKERAVIAGFSSHFDQRMVREHLPQTFSLLHYRIANVSTFRDCIKAWFPDALPDWVTKRDQTAEHRALPDCVAALHQLRLFRSIIDEGLNMVVATSPAEIRP